MARAVTAITGRSANSGISRMAAVVV